MWLATLTMLSTLATLTMLATLTKIYLKEVFPFLSFQKLLCKLYSIVGGGLVFDVVKVTVMILLPLVVGFASAFVAG